VTVRGISSMATGPLLADLVADYQRARGETVAIESVGGVDAAKRIRAGEAFDLAVLSSDAMDALEKEGHLLHGTRVDVVRSRMAIAIAAGAPRPDLASEDAVRDAVRSARRVGYSTGPSGNHLLRLIDRWGLADELRPRLMQAPPGTPVGALVARGEVDLGFQQRAELMGVEGIEVMDGLPQGVQSVTVFAAQACARSDRRRDTERFLQFLASPATSDAKRRRGMEPAEA